MVYVLSLVGVLSCLLAVNANGDYTGNGETREYWMSSGRDALQKARQKPNIGVAKNVILFLGDGMGVSTVTAARILKGQLEGHPGEESELSFESFPHVGLSKTYNQDQQTPDSAGTATAFLSGVKTNSGLIGVDARCRYGNCSTKAGTELETILDWAHAKGKSVGMVTTTRITHATPAALYAKSPARSWENDYDMSSRGVTGACDDIAKQLVDNNIDVRVILGGGRSKFIRNNDTDTETGRTYSSARADGRNLIEDWQRKHGELNHSYRYVWNSSAFYDVNPETTDYLLGFPNVLGCVDGTFIRLRRPTNNEGDFVNRKGYHSLNVQVCCDHRFMIRSVVASWPGSVHDSRIFRASTLCANFENGLFSDTHMQYALDRADDIGGEPTLAEMTEKAITILARNPKGYFLLVEGGRIDHAHHASRAKKSLHETLEFSDAVEKAGNLTSDVETLTLVTADHSHVFTIGGYSSRGNPIFGLSDDEGVTDIADDGKPFTTLSYANGPGAYANSTGGIRPDLTNQTTDDKDFRQQSTVPLSSETHGGEDVAIYARGPMSHLIHGVHEQSYIAHVMAYASCVGSYSEASACAMADVLDQHTGDGVAVRVTMLTLFLSFICTIYCKHMMVSL